jgi:RHS repeat-associated protein
MLTRSTPHLRGTPTARPHTAGTTGTTLQGRTPWVRRHPTCPQFARSVRRRLVSGSPGRVIACFALISSLIICPLPASSVRAAAGLVLDAPEVMYIAVRTEARALAAVSASPSDGALISWIKRLFGRGKIAPQQETPADRISHVSSVKINPPKYVGRRGQSIPLIAMPLDTAGRTLHGVRISYSSSDTAKLTVDERGVATLLQPGVAWVNARAGTATARVPILVLAGAPTIQTDAEWEAEQARLKHDGTVVTGVASNEPGLIPSLLENLAPTAHAQSGGYDSNDMAYDELWSDPRNLVGSPRNRVVEQTNIGQVMPEGSNFRLAIPIDSLPGRGVPVNLSLYYNSRIWSRHGNAVTFNAVNTWPGIGFTLGFGRIVTYGSDPNTKFMLIDSDGTRHYLGSGVSNQISTYQTNDGTHITYVGTIGQGTLYYPNGTNESFFVYNNRLLPFYINDTNGNYCSIAYTGAPWHIALFGITDSDGRSILMNYDSSNNLTSITAPGIGGTSQNPVTVTLAQFDYANISPSTSFSGLTVENVPSSGATVLSHVYFPTSQTGYRFDYSAYGMIYNVSKRRQMTVDPNTGAIGDGVESAHATFNYPLTASSLTDAPAFTQRSESPGSANSFTYSTFPANTAGPNTLTFILTPPDAASNPGYTVRYLTRSTDGTSPASGLLIQSDTLNYSGVYSQSVSTAYANDPGGSPQVQSVITHDNIGGQIQVNYDHDQYGNVTNMREFGYQVSGVWDVRRRTHYVYVTDSNYINKYMRSLMTEKDVYDALLDNNDANDVLIAKSTFQYDNYAAMGNMENYGGNYTGNSPPPNYNTAYDDQTLTVRGNLTGKTDYSDVVNQISETFSKKFDIFGNVVQEQVSCCNLNTYTFTVNTYWSSPDQTIKGDPNNVHLTQLLTRDFDTSLATASTDPNNLQMIFGYDNSGRSTQTLYPSGASKTMTYNDGAMSTQKSVNFTSGGTNDSAITSQTMDGWGRQVQSLNSYGGQVNTTYDPLGRAIAQTNPFPVGGSPSATTTTSYDPLGRVTQVALPDGNTTQTSFSSSTTTATDQVGRKTQKQQDGLGRLISVTEQDSSGGLTLTTNYTYDLLNNLTQVNQGGQIRAFKYDALSRKSFERLPEQSATINDGTGTMWSRSYTYTSFDKVSTRTDARGVVTTYGYDNVNRLISISYNTSSAPGVAPTGNVTYNYDTSTSSSTKGLLLSITMALFQVSTYQETLSYDSLERVSSRNWTKDAGNYTTSYQYNTANELTQTTYPDGRVVATTYSTNAQVASLTEPSSGAAYVSSTSFNVAGLMSAITLGNGVTEAYTYDANRLQLTSQTATASGGPTGGLMKLNYSYQAAAGQMGTGTTAGNVGQLMGINNNSTINGSPESAVYTYDLERRLATSAQTSNGQTATRRFDYDRWGNRLDEWDAVSGGNEVQAITLNQSGGAPTNGIATISGAGESVYNTPGQCGSPSTVSVGRTGRYVRVQLMGTNYLHLAEVQVMGTSGQNLALGKTATQSSTAFGGTANRANDGNTDGNFADGSVSHTGFQAQPWWQVDLGSSQQVSSVNVWNRTDCCQSRTSNFNVIVSDQPITTIGYIYDAAGNTTYDGAHAYQYDAENRLTSVDSGSASYAYDHMNRRIVKTVGSSSTHYTWDGGRVLAEHNAATGAGIADYVYASNLMIGTGSGNALSGTASFTYFLSDRLNTRVLTDKYGNYAGQQSHLPFGEDFGESGTQEKHRFTTYERDAEATTDYAVNRHYEYTLGRFAAADPIADGAFQSNRRGGCSGRGGQTNADNPESLNLYGYSGNDPINSSDPTGLETVTACSYNSFALPDPWNWLDPFVGLFFGLAAGTQIGSMNICVTFDVLYLVEALSAGQGKKWWNPTTWNWGCIGAAAECLFAIKVYIDAVGGLAALCPETFGTACLAALLVHPFLAYYMVKYCCRALKECGLSRDCSV